MLVPTNNSNYLTERQKRLQEFEEKLAEKNLSPEAQVSFSSSTKHKQTNKIVSSMFDSKNKQRRCSVQSSWDARRCFWDRSGRRWSYRTLRGWNCSEREALAKYTSRGSLTRMRSLPWRRSTRRSLPNRVRSNKWRTNGESACFCRIHLLVLCLLLH